MWYRVLSQPCLKAVQGERKPEFSLELADTKNSGNDGVPTLVSARDRTF